PSSPPITVTGFIFNATSIKLNWTNISVIHVVEYIKTGGVTRSVLSTSENEIMLTDLSPMSTYTFMVYSYEDIISANSTATTLKFD
uniref:Fibronectin type-III domain-containing protein n=1 Tax=Amphimedon queenslandica TaxID=400682 RepID=A0A1X7UA54_AMPQE